MSRAIRRRADVESGPPGLEKLIRHSREDYQHNVRPELRRHRWFVGRGETHRLKQRRAANRPRSK